MKNKFFIITVLFSILVQTSFSQSENDTDTIAMKTELDEVVVTATKTMRNLTEVPSRISVVNARIIEASPAQLVDDILRFTPGVNVDRSIGIYSSNPAVTVRGLSGDEQARTLVLMNGIPTEYTKSRLRNLRKCMEEC